MRCSHKLQEDKISHDDDAQHEPHLLPLLLLRLYRVGVRVSESQSAKFRFEQRRTHPEPTSRVVFILLACSSNASAISSNLTDHGKTIELMR